RGGSSIAWLARFDRRKIPGEVGDRAEIGLVRIEGGRTDAAVSNQLLGEIDSADSHHLWVPVRAPDILSSTGVGSAAAVRTGSPAVAGGKQHQDTCVDGLDLLPGEGMIRVGGIGRVPALLEDAPTVGEDVRRAVCGVAVDGPLKTG